MTTILACDVLPDMIIRTMYEPERQVGPVALATFRVASVDKWRGTVYIHADSRSSQIFEIPDHVQVQVLQWPTYAHEIVLNDSQVMESWREDPEYLTPEQVYERGQSALDRFVSGGPVKRDEGEKYGFKPGGITPSPESIAGQAAVERVLRRQQSKGQHPSNGVA